MKKSVLAPAGSVCLLLVAACAGGSDDAAARLHALFDREWELRLEESPHFATTVGRHEYDHLLGSVSAEDQARRAETWRGILDELHAIDPTTLGEADRISHAIFESQIENGLASFEFREYEVPINSDSGFHTAIARLPREMPFATVGNHENYLARLRAVPGYFDQQIANMRAGLARGMTLPRVVLQEYDVTIRSHVVDDPEESVFWAPLASMPETLDEAERRRLEREGREAIVQAVVPAYRAFLDFMTREYIPGARETLGASELPDGEDYYALQIRRYTTLDLTPEEIHEIGLGEVARIRAEMEAVIDEVEFDGGFAQFLEFLRTDPRFYAETPQELLMLASYLAKRMDGELPSLFKTLPRLPYGVEPVPDHLAPVYTAGRYVGAPEGSKEPGYYWVNTYDLDSRPLYALEALTLHEAVPGHHLQIALNNELEELPNFRRYSYLSAFGEGWGLYSERLGLEAGFYTDPYSNFGRLTYEMWRACRLVVDTGIHAMGWTREQAMEYLTANTALSLHEVRTEIDRYIAWPGQALAYKIGERKILELRERAESELGPRFDIREFHDAVLLNGSVPLPVLERAIEAYIASAAVDPH
jgi:uncharacterized protein (DUF885 family)